MKKLVSMEENESIVNEMLKGNEVIEKALEEWKHNRENIGDMASIYKSITDRDRKYGGLIVSVESGSVPAGADNVEFFNGDKPVKLNKVRDSDDEKYLLVFTSRERFREYNDTAGVVMFIREVFSLLADIEGVNGIVINMGKEEIIINKCVMKMISQMIKIIDRCET